MKLNSIRLENFRNYQDQSIELGDRLNIFIGDNGEGKTNIIEAIYLLSLGKSFRTSSDNLIKDKTSLAKIIASMEGSLGQNNVKMIIEGDKKRAFLNDVPLKNISKLIGGIYVVSFTPEDLLLLKEGPEIRRKYLDTGLCQQSKAYMSTLLSYQKAIKERNALLKSKKGYDYVKENILVWNSLVSEQGLYIIKKRLEYLGELSNRAKPIQRELSADKERISLAYLSPLLKEGTDRLEIVYEEMLKRNLSIDIKRGYTTLGPHREDFKVMIKGHDIKDYGSQGQIRTAVLSLKMAELYLLEQSSGEMPILLLDDVLSELDKGRQNLLLEMTSRYQTLITTTDINSISAKALERAKVFKIDKGSALEIS